MIQKACAYRGAWLVNGPTSPGRERPSPRPPASPGGAADKRTKRALPETGGLRRRRRLMEKKTTRQELARQQYSKKSTARSLGISLNTLWRKMCDAD